MTNYKLTNSFIIASFALCVACNNSDYKTDDGGSKDTAASATSRSTDTVAASPVKPATTSATGTVAKRKGKMSIKMPAGGNAGAREMVKDREGVYNWAQAMPEFPGGQNALDNYVNNHIDYPQQAIDDNTAGTVRVSFVVDEHGKVTKAHVIGDKLGNGLDEQALKVVSNMPAWKPGKVNGKNVKTRLELPIAFQVEA
jgi:TonB family protein